MQDELLKTSSMLVDSTPNFTSSIPPQIKREVFKYCFFSLNIFACLTFVTQPTWIFVNIIYFTSCMNINIFFSPLVQFSTPHSSGENHKKLWVHDIKYRLFNEASNKVFLSFATGSARKKFCWETRFEDFNAEDETNLSLKAAGIGWLSISNWNMLRR